MQINSYLHIRVLSKRNVFYSQYKGHLQIPIENECLIIPVTCSIRPLVKVPESIDFLEAAKQVTQFCRLLSLDVGD